MMLLKRAASCSAFCPVAVEIFGLGRLRLLDIAGNTMVDQGPTRPAREAIATLPQSYSAPASCGLARDGSPTRRMPCNEKTKWEQQDGDQEAERSGHVGRRHRPVEPQLLHQGPDGLQDAQHRPHRQRRHDLHRLVRGAELHRRPRVVHHRPVRSAHRPHQGRVCPARNWASRPRTSPSPRRSSRSAIAPASSARTISATATSTCRRCTASTSSSATSIT